MILAQHCRNRVPFGRKLKQREKIVAFVGHMQRGVNIDVGNLIDVGVGFNPEIGECEAVVVVEFALGLRVHRVAVEHHITDVHALGRQRDVVAVGTGTHRKQIPAARHKVADAFGHGQFHLGDLGVPQLRGTLLLLLDILLIPGGVPVVSPEFPVLAGEILVVKVQPVVFGQFPFDDFIIV